VYIENSDLYIYKPSNDGNPTINLGSTDTEKLEIKAQYESGAQGLDVVKFITHTAGSSANDARFSFEVDEASILQIKDAGLNLTASMNLSIGNTDILADSSGTTTLSNIDALDATTTATIEAAVETNIDSLTGPITLTQGSTGGGSALTIDNDDVDKIALDIDAKNTTANVIDIDTQALTTGDAIFIDANSLTTGSAINIDVDDALTTTATKTLHNIEYHKSSSTPNTITSTTAGSIVKMSDAGSNHGGSTHVLNGYIADISKAGDDGTNSIAGFQSNISVSGISIGAGRAIEGIQSYFSNIVNGAGVDFKSVSSADTGDYFSIATTTNGATTLTTVDDDTTGAHLTFDIDGFVINDSAAGRYYWYDNGNTDDYLELKVGADGDSKFKTLDVAATAAHFEIEADGNITLDAAGTTTIESAGLIKLDGEAGVEIENGAAAAALLIDNNTVDQVALDIDASNTTANVIDVDSRLLTTGDAIKIDCDNLTTGSAITIDVDDELTTSATKNLVLIDYDKSGVTASGQTSLTTGLQININDNATNHASGNVRQTGIAIGMDVENAQGSISQTGVQVSSLEFAGGFDIADNWKSFSSASPNAPNSFDFYAVPGGTLFPAGQEDYFGIKTSLNGATSLKTFDYSGALAHMIIQADGNVDVNGVDITLDASGDIALEANTTITGDLTVNGDNATFQSANADDPIVTIKNTSNAANDMASLNFVKDRDGGTAAIGDNLGEIYFSGEDASGNTQEYSRILSEIDVATHGQESGILKFGVANHDGGNGYGLILQGGSANDEVDVTVGLGTGSLTTITGDATVTSKLTAKTRKFLVSSSTDGDYIGDVVYFGGTTSMTVGKIYHYKSDGTWEIANADAQATADGLLAVALGAASDTNGMLLRGMVTLDHDPGDIGDVLYVQSDNAGTPGNATATAPSANGDCVRIIGYQVSHASNGNI